MYGFGIQEKICGLWFFGVFLCGFVVFAPPLCSPLKGKVKVEQHYKLWQNVVHFHHRKTSKHFLNEGPKLLGKQTRPNVGLEC